MTHQVPFPVRSCTVKLLMLSCKNLVIPWCSIFFPAKKIWNFHSPAGLVWRIVWGTAEQSGTHATDFSPGTLPKGGPENQMGITSRKSINCKTDSPWKRQLYEKNPNSVVLGQYEHSSDRGFFSDYPDRWSIRSFGSSIEAACAAETQGLGNAMPHLFSPYLGKWSNLTNMFRMGWNRSMPCHTMPFHHGLTILIAHLGRSFVHSPLMLVIYHTGTAFVFKTHWVRQHKVPPEAWHLDLSRSVIPVPQVMVCNVLVAITLWWQLAHRQWHCKFVGLCWDEGQTRFVHHVATSAPMLKKLRQTAFDGYRIAWVRGESADRDFIQRQD